MTTFTSRHRRKLVNAAAGLLGLLAILVLWDRLAAGVHPLILPSPTETWQALRVLWAEGSISANLAITVRRTVYGYVLALAMGFFLAVLAKGVEFFRALLKPILTIAQIVPPVAWTLVAVIWFGVASGAAPVFLIFIVTLPLAFSSITAGLDSIDGRLVEMARVYRRNWWAVVKGIYLPALLPHLVATLGVGFSFAWKAAIFAEFVGSNSGVGFVLSTANSNLETEKVFAWVAVLVGVMLVYEYGFLVPVRRRVARWSR